MPHICYFQTCPVCGRRLQVQVEHIGRVVACFHCHASILAQDPELSPPIWPLRMDVPVVPSVSADKPTSARRCKLMTEETAKV